MSGVLGLVIVGMALAVLLLLGRWALSLYQWKIPVGTTVALGDRLVRITAHHRGAGIGAREDPARYVYVYADAPPPYARVITPVWDAAAHQWTHLHTHVVAWPMGYEEAMQVAQFNLLADYRR